MAVRKKDDSLQEDRRRWNNGDAHWNWEPGEQLEVLCYTNCAEAELFLNGKSLGKRNLKASPECFLQWETEFEAGTLKVVGKHEDGSVVCSELQTADNPSKLVICADSEELTADGQDIAHLEIEVQDEAGRLVFSADPSIRLTLEGPGEILGLENGDPQDLEPYSSRSRKAYRGRLLAYVRTNTTAGELVIKAEAEGLEPARVVIRTR